MGFDLDFPINKTDENGIIWLHYSAEINATKKNNAYARCGGGRYLQAYATFI